MTVEYKKEDCLAKKISISSNHFRKSIFFLLEMKSTYAIQKTALGSKLLSFFIAENIVRINKEMKQFEIPEMQLTKEK